MILTYLQDGMSVQNHSGGPVAPPGGLLAQALTERKPSNPSGNYAFNNFGPLGGPTDIPQGKQDPVVERTLSALKKYKSQPEELKRIFNENPDMRAVFNQIKLAQMPAAHGQHNSSIPPANNLQRTVNPRPMLPVQQQQQQQFVGNGLVVTDNHWNAPPMSSKMSSPIQRGQANQAGQFGMEPQQQMYISQQQPHQPDMWMSSGDQMYSGVPPNRGIVPPQSQHQQLHHHHHQMGHPGPPPYPYGRANVESGSRIGYPTGSMGTQHQGDFPGSAPFARYQPHPVNAAMNPGHRPLPPQPPPMGSPNGVRMGYDEGGPMQMMGVGVRQNMMGGVSGAAMAARGRLPAVGGPGMVRPSLPPAQLGSPKGMGRRQQQQQDINPLQYQLQHQQHEMVNGGLMNGGNYQVVGGGGGTAYNVYQNQSTHPQPYNDPHQQQLNERALGIDKFMMQQQQQQHLQPNGNSGNEPGIGYNDSLGKSMTSSSVSSFPNQWKMTAEEHRKTMLSNLHQALREQNDPNLLSLVESIEAETFLQCDTQSQYDYRLARWLASVLDKAKTMTHEAAPAQPPSGNVQQQQQQQHVPGPPMPPISDGKAPTDSALGTGSLDEGGIRGTEGGTDCAAGSNGGSFSESSLSVKNPILANLLPSKSGGDAVNGGASDNNEVTSPRLDDGKASINSSAPSTASVAAAGPITALTPPSSSESLPSSSPPQTTTAPSPKSHSPRTAVSVAAGPAVKYSASTMKSPAELSLSSSSPSLPSLSAPSSNAKASSPSSTCATPSTVGSSSSTSSSSALSTFQSPSSSSSSTFSVPSTAAGAAGAPGNSGGGSGSGSNSNGRRTSSGQSGGPAAAAGANGPMNKSGNTNPHSVDSGIGSPPRSIASSSLYSPKIQQGTSPSLATVSSDAGASPEK